MHANVPDKQRLKAIASSVVLHRWLRQPDAECAWVVAPNRGRARLEGARKVAPQLTRLAMQRDG